MPDRLRLTILGCGSSPGTPRINGDWGNCDPSNPKNRRRRAAAMLERVSAAGTTRIIIDTGPDFRDQMLSAGIDRIDAAVYTHPHADHIHGIDDLRGYALAQRRLIDIYADRPTMERLKQSFGYCFKTPPGSSYPPILNPITFAHEVEFSIDGPGGPIALEPLPFIHGDIIALGFRIGAIAYCPDVSDIPHMTTERLAGLDLLVINALQYKTHPSHLSLDQALEWIERLAPRHAVLTHMHIPLDYDAVARATPDHVEPAYDGMQLEFDITSD
jgi:phosphoribosyl 1,2-cyclic phosphate phosphodiesterase